MARKGKATINPSPGSVMYCFCPALALSRPGGSAIECSCLSLASSRGCGDSAIPCFCLTTPSLWSRNAGAAIGGSARDFRPLCLPRALPVPVQALRGIQGPGMAGSRLETVGSVFTRCVLGAGAVPRARGRLSLLPPFLGGSDPGQASLVLCPASEKLCLAASPLEFLSSHVQDRTFPLSKWKVK